MRTVGAAMASSIPLFLSLLCSAGAQCDLSGYDNGPPPAFKGTVNDNYAQFDYGSDVDPQNGQFRVWNFILNRRTDKGIGAKWPKAGIGINLLNPLPPGMAACKIFTTAQVLTDSDAPITYGTNSQSQPATVYVPEPQRKLGSTVSSIRTSYTGDDGKAVDLNVLVAAFQTDGGISFNIEHSSSFVVAIAGLAEVLTAQQIEAMSHMAKSQNANVEQATYFEYTKEESPTALASLFDPEKGPNLKTHFLFFSGPSAKFGVDAPGSAIEKVLADVVILDAKNKRPLFGTNVSLLVPAKK